MLVEGLSFVFPMYNEEGNIERMAAETLAIAPKVAKDFEIVIVNDASTDRSPEIAERLAREHPEIMVIHHWVNRRLGGTLRTGFAAASKEFVLYIDSDLPIRMPDILPAFELLKDSDMVIGYRIGRAEGIRRHFQSWCYNKLIRLLFGLKVKDVNFSFKLFRSSILERICLHSEGSFIDAELLIETRKRGFRIKEYGLNYYPREAGVSNLSGMGVIYKILKEMLRAFNL